MNNNIAMPLAVPPEGADESQFYSQFVGKLEVSGPPGEDLVIHVTEGPPLLSRIHSPMKAALRFLPKGTDLKDGEVDVDTLVLRTWPFKFLALQTQLGVKLPSEIRLANVAPAAVRAAVEPLYHGRKDPQTAVERFMKGDGLIRVKAGTIIGAAGEAPTGPHAKMVSMRMLSARGTILNAVSILTAFAKELELDKELHPLLIALGPDNWVEILVFSDQDELVPLPNEPFELYLADGSVREGSSDENGRIFVGDLPSGLWFVNLPLHPSFTWKE